MLEDRVSLNHDEALTFTLPPIPEEEGAWLEIIARIHNEQFQSGSAAAIAVLLNDGPITIERLINKPWYYTFQRDTPVRYFHPDHGLWALPYYPFESARLPDPQIHRYVFSVRSLLHSGSSNRLVLENHFEAVPNSVVQVQRVVLHTGATPPSPSLSPGERHNPGESHALAPLRERAISLHRGLEAALDTRAETDAPERSVILPRSSYASLFDIEQPKAGELALTVAGNTYHFHAKVGQADRGWERVSDLISAADTEEAIFSSEGFLLRRPPFSLERRWIRHATHLEVRDTFTNHLDADLPLGFFTAMATPDPHQVRDFRIAGVRQARIWANGQPNRNFSTAPILYFGQDRSGAAMVLEDDVMRNQGSVLAWDSTVGAGTDMFYLPPGTSHTFVTRIYPTPEPDYYATINALRQEWRFHEPITGLFGFAYPHQPRMDQPAAATDQGTAALLDRTGMQLVGVMPIAPTDGSAPAATSGRSVYGNERPERIRQAAAHVAYPFAQRVRSVRPEVKTLIYIDVHLINDDGDRAQLMELEDSVILNAQGQPHPFRAGWLYHVLPFPGSSAEARVMETLRIYLDEFKFDGLFLDEWAHSNARVSYAHEDGVSAILDQNFRIQRKVAIVPIILKDFHVRFAQEALTRQAVLIANHFPATQAAAALPMMYFAEPISRSDPKIAAAQIAPTPMSLNVKRSHGLWGDVHAFLERGVLLCYYARRLQGEHALRQIYPITVREVHAGYVIGDAKIVTRRSGRYSLGSPEAIIARIYGGPDGLFRRQVSAEAAEGTSLTFLDLQLDPLAQELAVIEPVGR